MRERRYGAKGERACKPNCKFSVSWIVGILISILISIWKSFRKKRRGGETRGGVGWLVSFRTSRLISIRTSRLISIWDFFPNGEGKLVEGGNAKGALVFLGFSWAFTPVANS